jgi:excinuclease ABC subunit C
MGRIAQPLLTDPDRLSQRLRELPAEPGCYLMRDVDDRILYIGKSKSLRSRVRSYFRDSHDLSPPHPSDGASGLRDRIHRHRQ